VTRGAVAALITTAALAAVLSPAAAEPTRSQVFFEERLLVEDGTSKEIKKLLRDNDAFVARTTIYEDITDDGRDDAVVRVTTGGVSGVIALYVLSTDGRGKTSQVRSVYRAQRLLRGSARIVEGTLVYRSSSFVPGDEPCCPSRQVDTELRWDDEDSRFRVASRREVAPPAATPTPTP
jgi:hypothetical protein